ncbi:MAG: adenylate/guanylate cyclase domain-containing protein [candidate division WOR-3 bacterium]
MSKNGVLVLFSLIIIFILFVILEIRPQIYLPFERFLYDKREFFEMDFERKLNEIIIVDIDEKSIKELGRYHNWPRYYFGKAIETVSIQNPYVIGIDIVFSSPDSINDFTKEVYLLHLKRENQKLFSGDSLEIKAKLEKLLSSFSFDSYVASSISKAKRVVLASYLTEDFSDNPQVSLNNYYLGIEPPKKKELTFPGIVIPVPEYLNAGAKIGLVNDVFDSDGVRRREPLFFNYKGKTLPSFSFAIVGMAVKNWEFKDGKLKILGREINLEEGVFLRIKYQGDINTFKYVSFVDVIKKEVPDTLFKKKIVLFGSSLPELYDYSQTPFGAKLPGVECHANVIHNLLFSKPITIASKRIIFLISIVLISLTLFITNKTSPYISPIITLIIIGGYLLFTILMYMTYFVSYEMSRPVIGITLAFFTGLLSKVYFEEEEKKWIKDLFSRYVSKEVVNQIVKLPYLNLEGKRQEISVLFCDLRDFTPRAEMESPESIVEVLNIYFEEMSEAIFSYGGMVDKYLGDGIMALFGVPIFNPGHADKAVSCAIEMQNRIYSLNQKEILKGKPPLEIGIGINSGESIVGNVGSANRVEYTAIGDVVNTAARIEPLNKMYKTKILISEKTKNKLQGNYKIDFVGKVQLKGKTESIGIYSVSSELSLW